MTTFSRVEVTRRTIRYEFSAPVEYKAVGVAIAWLTQEFETINGRKPEFDNDWWLEPMDDGIAFCFAAESRFGEDTEVRDGV